MKRMTSTKKALQLENDDLKKKIEKMNYEYQWNVESAKCEIRNEMEAKMAKSTEDAYKMGYKDCEDKMKHSETEYSKLKNEHILLQVKYDQLLRATKELSICLQYETGNGFVK